MPLPGCYDTEGGERWFHTTQWTEIRRLPRADDSLKTQLLESLLSRYWSPVFWYIRRKGYDRDTAKDLTQDFFHEIVLDRALFDKADRDKGRLRNLLLVALERYLASFERKRSARKRRPTQRILALDGVDMPEPAVDADPHQAFCRAWAAELLDSSLAELSEMCHGVGDTVIWSVFKDVLLDPLFQQTERPSFQEVCRRYGIASESKASNLLTTAKRRFRSILRRKLRD